MIKSDDKEVLNFIKEASTVDLFQFIGIAKILGIKPINSETKELKKFEDFLSEMAVTFMGMNRRQRRNLLKIIRSAKKAKPVSEKEESILLKRLDEANVSEDKES